MSRLLEQIECVLEEFVTEKAHKLIEETDFYLTCPLSGVYLLSGLHVQFGNKSESLKKLFYVYIGKQVMPVSVEIRRLNALLTLLDEVQHETRKKRNQLIKDCPLAPQDTPIDTPK